jgi:predicted pyridoxine 5'-phosphate oxidase superfamily flavin-nucleotide-binding protein
MSILTEEMQAMVAAQLNFLSTADQSGNPQVGPKGTMRVLNDHQLTYNEHTGKQAWQNVQATKKAAVASVDHGALKGYRFEGTVEYFQTGPHFVAAQKFVENKPLPQPIAAVIITVERIYTLDAGPKAGDLIG